MPIRYKDVFGYNDCEEVHRYVLEQLPDGATIVELGVGHGRGIAMLLELTRQLGKHFRVVGIDNFIDTQENLEAGYSQLSPVRVYDGLTAVGAMPDQYELIVSDSAEAADRFDRVNYVFLDADHSNAGVLRDMRAWWPKVVPGGFMGGHDWDFVCIRDAVRTMFPQAVIYDQHYCNSWLQQKEV